MGTYLPNERLDRCLAEHRIFDRAQDADETCDRVGQVFRPHTLQVKELGKKLNARLDSISLQQCSISRLKYNVDISVESSPMDNFVMVMMPISGRALIRCGKSELVATPDRPAVVNYMDPLFMSWDSDCDQLIARIDRRLLERICEEKLGRPLHEPLRFSGQMYASPAAAQAWNHIVEFISTCPPAALNPQEFPIIAGYYEKLLASTLVSIQENNYLEAINGNRRSIAPAFIRRAEEYIESHIDQPLTVEEIASHLGVSERSLFSGFKKYKNTSPMAFIQYLRLQRAHNDFKAARNSGANASVTRIAMSWGFTHMGNFSKTYKQTFGEMPSETLGRR